MAHRTNEDRIATYMLYERPLPCPLDGKIFTSSDKLNLELYSHIRDIAPFSGLVYLTRTIQDDATVC